MTTTVIQAGRHVRFKTQETGNIKVVTATAVKTVPLSRNDASVGEAKLRPVA